MSNYTIEGFWKRRLRVTRTEAAKFIQGWANEETGLDTFKEAPLTLSTEFGTDSDAERSAVLVISAPGAVGKSTLARQIAFATGAVYIDLAKADPVGANTLSGGLLKSGLYERWQAGTTAVLIDGLDEARLRVTQKAFEAFLGDVAEISKDRVTPTVLFGRTGAAQDAWLILSESRLDVPVLEIGYYGRDASIEFADVILRKSCPGRERRAADREALELLLDSLRGQTESDGDRFAGYAPVLLALAGRVAREGNPAALVAQIKRGGQLVTLQTIVSAIMERERGKLQDLDFENKQLTRSLYSQEEQLDRLVARIYHQSPPGLPVMGHKDAELYSSALDTWVAEHPFLDGGVGPSSVVFDAAISNRALKNSATADAALRRELSRGAAANPFLSEFYLPEGVASSPVYLPPEHIGIVYSSLRARLSLGDSANLSVEGPEDAKEEEALRAEVEITLARRTTDRPRLLHFHTEQTGRIRLGAHIEDVDITASHSRVEIGPGAEAILMAPVSIQCAELLLTADKLIVETSSSTQAAAVYLESQIFDGAPMTSAPVLRGDVSLSVSWPNARSYPWTNFATEPTPDVDPRVDEALRRLRKFVIAFRSHGRGTLARYKYKIESERMTKGAGRLVLDLMLAEKILTLQGSLYFLDPDGLAVQAGTDYRDCMARRFSAKAIAFAQRALA